MRKNVYHLFGLGALLILSSCASKRVQMTKEARSAFEDPSVGQLPDEKPAYTLYAIGDAGYMPEGNETPAVTAIAPMLQKEDPKKSGIIFLGDNIYPSGMPKKEDDSRAEAEAHLDQQIDLVRTFKGDVVFIPGNHDWRQEDAQKGVRRQAKYIEEALNAKVHKPNKGCSGPKVIKLNPTTVMLVFDSEWYLQNWDNYIDFNEHCEYKTREAFLYELSDLIRKYAKDKRLIVSMHHPLYTYGVHGGRFGFRDHMFPLTNLKKPIHAPLPGLGTLYTVLRRSAGVREDINGKRYQELRDAILATCEPFEDVIFLSGHDHNLQYIYKDEHHHIVSGSGSKINFVDLGQGSSFAAGKKGFAKVFVYEQGETWVQFYDASSGQAKLLYTTQLTNDLPLVDNAQVPYGEPTTSYETAKILDRTLEFKGLGKSLLGEQYNKLYNLPYTAPVLNISEKHGGLTPVKRGGGMQTLSLRLQDENERDYVIRAVKKDGSKLLADDFQNTFATDLLDYFLTTAHPMSAYAIPPLAKSIGILHTEPEFVYVPKQKALGEYNVDHGDKLYLFEARPAGDRSDQESFGRSTDIVSTDDMLTAMREDYRHRPNQPDVVRNRLFDAVLNDWDRHDDQWRWAAFEGEGKKVSYRPVPRDRDQAFSRFRGLMISIGRWFSPSIGKFQTFSDRIKHASYFNFNGRYFDRSFMNEMTWADWKEQANHITNTLTDEAIEEGVRLMADTAYALTGKEIIGHLKARRDNLEDYAARYYKHLARAVDIPGTDAADYFLVTHQGSETRVQVFDMKKDRTPRTTPYYDRVFKSAETKEIRLYGLDGKDVFKVEGDKGRIKTRLIGGTDKDEFKNASSRRALVYDTPDHTDIDDKSKLGLHLTNDYHKNAYDRKAFKYNHRLFLPNILFNPDNGLMVGANFTATFHGFKKEPYASKHRLSGIYSVTTDGYRLEYNGHFAEVIGKLNLGVDGLLQDDFFTTNFFGLGNESINRQEDPENLDRDFNRVRMSIQSANVRLDKALGSSGKLFFGPQVRNYEVNATADRFFTEQNPLNANFEGVTYLGGEVGMQYRYTDDAALPTQGLDFGLIVDYLADVNADEDYNAAMTHAHLSIYYPIDNDQRFVLAHRVGGGFTLADDDNTPFYLLQQLGGNSGLRGFNNERFTGGQMFYLNNDLRIHLFNMKNYILPGSVGLFAGFDLGRVWIDGDDSEKWHNNYGGGLYVNAFNMAVIRTGFFTSGDEQGRVTIGMGFDF